MTTTTYLSFSGGYKVTIDPRGRVVESNCESFPVGAVAPARMLKACGWRADRPRKVTQYDAWGRKV